MTVTVGAGGAASVGKANNGGPGASGAVSITWTDPSCTAQYYCSGSNRYYRNSQCQEAFVESCSYGCSSGSCVVPPLPTCSISVSPSSINQGSGTTISWSSSNATYVRIFDDLGIDYNWFLPSGSPTWYPSTSRSYHCYGYNSSTGQSGSWSSWASVTVIPPPTATISASPASINVGQSTTITATYAAGTGDTITGTAINQPYYTNVTPTTPVTPRTYNFSPSSPGTYTFYAFVNTPRYSWYMAKSTNVTVSAAANCTQDGVTVAHNGSRKFYKDNDVSQGESCEAASNTLTRTCTNGDLSGSDQYQWANCACSSTPSTIYSCDGNTIIERITDDKCNVSTDPPYATCIPPNSCVPNSSVCVPPPVTGTLNVSKRVVRSGESMTVSWASEHAVTCTVSRTNGPSWSGKEGSYPTAINAQTTFTLTCDGGDDDALEDDLLDSETVDIAPTFEEL